MQQVILGVDAGQNIRRLLNTDAEEKVELLQALVRVLVVDDVELWRTFVRIHLEKEPNLRVISVAADGLDAIRKAEKLRPDLILLDISLPGLNGLEVARQIRSVAARSIILFLTGQSDPDVVRHAFSVGGLGYVVKSDAAEDLIAGIESVLLGRKFVSSSLRGFDDMT